MASKIWRRLKFLGSGSYGQVFLAAMMDDSEYLSLMAVKSAYVPYAVDSLKLEGRFLAQLYGLPNIVRCFGEDISMENGRLVYNLLLEYADGGSLHDLIRNTYRCGSFFSEFEVACYASMLLRGLAGMHAQGIVHCDLKPANILVFPVHGGMSQLKIADFGLAKRVAEIERFRAWDRKKTYNRGTLLYSSPESVANGCHGTGADIWSLGCVVVEMMTGKYIWDCKDPKNLPDKILNANVLIPSRFSQDGKDFVKRCLERNRLLRWSAEELLLHPFIVKNCKIFGFDLSGWSEVFEENPFGVKGWVSEQNLFSTCVCEDLLQQRQRLQHCQHPPQQQQQQQFQPYQCNRAISPGYIQQQLQNLLIIDMVESLFESSDH